MLKGKAKLSMPSLGTGPASAAVFILLIVITLAFWLYIQKIFDHVREFQQSVVQTHVQIYMKLIDPSAKSDSDLLDLYEPVVMNAPYPSIFTGEDMVPIQELWHNVGVEPNDTSPESRNKLIKLVHKMDKSNPPVPVNMPNLISRTDTLTVYHLPPEKGVPLLITDKTSNYLFSRFVSVDRNSSSSMQTVIDLFGETSPPIIFEKENEPALEFHSTGTNTRWPMIIVKNGADAIYSHHVAVAQGDTTHTGAPDFEKSIRYLASNGSVFSFVTTTVPVETLWLFHYGDLPFLTLIGWLPLIELAVILVLLSIAMIGLITIKNAEQRSIWVGMAKETAHQLGTPISSLSGWYELLKIDKNPEMLEQALPEMEYDVRRLTRVAARFSNIGSKPELQRIPLSDVLNEVLDYYRARLPRMGMNVVINSDYNDIRDIMGNVELLNWALENLVKNALSAITTKDGVIHVSGSMSKDFKHVIIDFKDTGKGIAAADQKKVMKPGFTTKKRGWGLGLSLVKRIIEDYHKGRVFLYGSREGEGTTFRVILPTVND